MICDYARCWRESVVYIPGTPLAFCSSHALQGLGVWPVVRYAELVAELEDRAASQMTLRSVA